MRIDEHILILTLLGIFLYGLVMFKIPDENKEIISMVVGGLFALARSNSNKDN